jgi:hypothetical protein
MDRYGTHIGVVSLPRTEWRRWTVIAVAVHAVFAAFLLLGPGHGDPAWFIHLGSQRIPVALARKLLGPGVVVPHLDGHDGRFSWVQARDPFLLHRATDLANLDRPAYRAQRMAYPLLAAPWRVGGEYALVWGLLVTNLAAVGFGAWFATQLAVATRAPPRAGLAFALNPVVILGVVLDTSDVVALAALVAAVALAQRRRWPWAVAAGVLAALAKEPSLLGLAALAVVGTTIPRRWRIALIGLPGVAVVCWGVYARARLGWPPSQIQEFAAPFTGYLDAYRRGWRPIGNWYDAAVAVAVLAIAIATLRRWWRRRTLVLAVAVPFALLVPFLSAQVLDLGDNSLRVLGPVVTMLGIDWLAERDPQTVASPVL